MNLLQAVIWMFIGSIIVGYWITSSSLVESGKHIENSLTKFYLALFMALWMIVIEILMFSVHHGDYQRLLWLIPTFGSLGLVLWMLRAQVGVGDKNYLRAMIQHHSSAILTSKRILKKTKNKQVLDLAKQIIKSQEEEIDDMNKILS